MSQRKAILYPPLLYSLSSALVFPQSEIKMKKTIIELSMLIWNDFALGYMDCDDSWFIITLSNLFLFLFLIFPL